MSQEKYFRDELAFLREQGQEFSRVHPQLARYLDGQTKDPDVERLLEGFAFLTGRLRQKVRDEFPELTHSIINMLWPNYLRPVPSITIIRFHPDISAITERQVIPDNTSLHSKPVQGTICQFRTCRPVDIYPVVQQGVRDTHSRESSIVELDLQVMTDQPLAEMDMNRLRFYLGGNDYDAQMLYLWLNHHLDRIEIEVGDKVFPLSAQDCQVVGFDSEDSLLPYPTNVYEGYRVLQEFLTFPQGYMFFDLLNLSRTLPADLAGDFRIRFCFARTIPADVRIREESFQLYCTPAINLFEHDADPVELSGRHTEYRVIPSGHDMSHYEIFSIDRVEGWQEKDTGRVRGQARIYLPFESFQHEVERVRNRLALYYRVRVRDSIRNDGFDHFISFVRADETECTNFTEAVSLNITCTNRQLPIELGCGDINVPTDNTPPFASFENITEPTMPLRPVLDGSLLWTLISNLSLNYLSLLSRDALCSILRAYDFRALVDRQAEQVSRHRLEGITRIESAPVERLLKGLPVRGLRSEITLNPKAFSSEGELFLFATVLSRFFALYASINSFHELVVINADNADRYTWNIQTGQQPLI